MSDRPPILPGASVLPPPDDGSGHRRREAGGPEGTGVKGKRQHRDRFGVLNTFVDFTMADLIRSDIAVWLVLYRDIREGVAQTGQADISKRAGTSLRTAKRAIRRLSQRGLIVVVHRGGLNRGPSVYRVQPLPQGSQ